MRTCRHIPISITSEARESIVRRHTTIQNVSLPATLRWGRASAARVGNHMPHTPQGADTVSTRRGATCVRATYKTQFPLQHERSLYRRGCLRACYNAVRVSAVGTTTPPPRDRRDDADLASSSSSGCARRQHAGTHQPHVITCGARNRACNKAQGTRRDFRNALRRHARRVQACAQRKQQSGAQAQRNTSGAVDTSHAARALTAPYVLATAPRGAGGPCNLGCERHRTRSKSDAAASGPTLSNNTGQRGQEQQSQISQSAHTDTTTRHAPRTHTHTRARGRTWLVTNGRSRGGRATSPTARNFWSVLGRAPFDGDVK